jgi:hypothetical protein
LGQQDSSIQQVTTPQQIGGKEGQKFPSKREKKLTKQKFRKNPGKT